MSKTYVVMAIVATLIALSVATAISSPNIAHADSNQVKVTQNANNGGTNSLCSLNAACAISQSTGP